MSPLNFDFDNMTPEMIEALDLTEKAHKLVETEAYEEAAQALNQAESIEPMCIRIYIERGGMYAVQEKLDEALAEYDKAVLIDKKNAEVQYMLGNTWLLKLDFAKALEAYKAAEEYGYRSPFMVNNMGSCHEQLRHLDDAARCYQEAADMQPDWIEPRIRYINVLMVMRKEDEARSMAEKAVADFPHNDQVYITLADVLIAMQEPEEADEVLQTGLVNTIKKEEILIKQLKVWYFLDRYDDMKAQIAKLHEMELNEDELDAVDEAEAEMLVQTEMHEEACEVYERLLSREKLDAPRVEIRLALMTIYKITGNFEKLRSVAASSLKTSLADSVLCAAYAMEAIAVDGLGQKEEARALYQNGVNKYRILAIRNRDRMDVHVYRILCHNGLKEYDKALEELNYVEKVLGESNMTRQLRAEILKGQGKIAEAEAIEAEIHNAGGND